MSHFDTDEEALQRLLMEEREAGLRAAGKLSVRLSEARDLLLRVRGAVDTMVADVDYLKRDKALGAVGSERAWTIETLLAELAFLPSREELAERFRG